MLISLSIRDVVLIERLDISLSEGLCVLTGETGAGKSILLDALGLALGNRADSGLVRQGCDQAVVTAGFEVAANHPVYSALAEQGLVAEPGEPLLLRRIVSKDGRSRAFVNDQAVSVTLLRQLGDALVEVQGQFEQRGLLDPSTHRSLLDDFATLQGLVAKVGARYRAWREALRAQEEARANLEDARREEAFLRHGLEELEALDPTEGEAERLAEERQVLMSSEKIIAALTAADEVLTDSQGSSGGADSALARARGLLERVPEAAAERVQPILAALDRAAAELEDAVGKLHSLSADLDLDTGRRDEVEERFFALKETARKHQVEVDHLPVLRRHFAERLAAIEGGSESLLELEAATQKAREDYRAAAKDLTAARAAAAKRLDVEVARELPPLKLERAHFVTRVEPLEEGDWGPQGCERVSFRVATNPGSAPGALARIASGGEMARFLLALKVVLAEVGPPRSLVFDEVDAGIGGATADAVGQRLARLAENRQILVITHSPQVAARGRHHWRVAKRSEAARTLTEITALAARERREEIARMLSGAQVTDEARAAADKLMGAA